MKNMILNKLKYTICSLVLLGVLYSCDDFVDELPISEISPEQFYKDNAQLEAALIGAYDGVQVAYSDFYINTGEFRSDDFQPNGANASRNSLHNSTLDPGEGYLRWRNHYVVIDRVNRIIEAENNFEGADPNIIGQAYAIRSKVYFDLARMWNDVPVFTKPINTVSEAKQPQTPYAEIMSNLVIPDMLKAEEYLSTIQSNYRFSKSSVLAHQAEVYMWEKQEQLAKEAIEKLITLGSHSLVQTPEDWQNLFLNQPATDQFPDGPGKVQMGPELIFSIQYNFEETSSGVARAYNAGAAVTTISEETELEWIRRFPIDSLGWATKYPNTDPVFSQVVEEVDTTYTVPLYGDWRHFACRNENATMEDGLGSAAFGEARCTKFIKNRVGLDPNDDNTDIPVFRFADMILLLAEAELKLGNPNVCLDLINQVRTARQLPLASQTDFGNSFEAQLDFLLIERKLELFGEAKRWWDLVRNDKAVEVMTPILNNREVIPFGEDRIVWPIFREHLLENELLNQNPGWD
ncbi:RagB/SusD family nutrient uptake outer membrane protein [Tamlana sp. I1]|uniref:RagB/SusD family nutrient uptake outer membrane protein n=1 Tax=Tamlana sp. I1 TaxID=2762061 RepID=UPI00188F4C85|nr:RagB/SusD family nutrient uptake outer membrane protein [Tamlana sp. I1]